MRTIKIMATAIGVLVGVYAYAAAQEIPTPTANAGRQRLIQQFDTDKDGKLNEQERGALMRHLESRQGSKGGKGVQSKPSSQPSGKPNPEAVKKLLMVPENVKVIKNVEYAKVDDISLLLDIYLPAKAPELMPVIIWVHGGAWFTGSKEPCQIVSLSGKGYAIVSIDYRLTGQAQFPAQINDCKAAVRWVRANADKYGFDPDRVGAAGGSAGGHLVALMGTSGDVKELEGEVGGNLEFSSRVKAVCDLSGPTDFLTAEYVMDATKDEPEILRKALVRLLGGPWEEHRQAANMASPVYHISKDDPPFLIVHGDADNTIPVKHSRRLHERLKAAGLDATLHIVEGGGHGVGAYPGVHEKALAFFDKHLRDAAANGEGKDAKPSVSAPNILFILADQYRRDCVGISGNEKIHTPNLDRLSRDGAWFNRVYSAQPVCSPNRAAIITGLYPHSAGIQENCTQIKTVGNKSLPKTSLTMSEMLAPAGYDCGHFGKWHLGRRDAFKTFPMYQKDGRGEDHYFGTGKDRRYSVDVVTEDAIAFMEKPRTQPFYAYVSYYPPHHPFTVPEEYVERYKGIPDREQRIYYAMCEKVDEQIGELLKTLDKLGIAEKTLVVFTSDHGHNFVKRWNDHYKRVCYDTASRVPLIMRMPGVIPKDRRVDSLLSSVDLTPTIMSLLGKPVPLELQGIDFADLARGQDDKGRDYAFMENVPFTGEPEKGEERCVLDGKYKLILSTLRPPELYDLVSDPDEVNNRWGELKSSALVGRLIAQLRNWGDKTKDPLASKLIDAARL